MVKAKSARYDTFGGNVLNTQYCLLFLLLLNKDTESWMERDNLTVACSLRKLGCDLFVFIIRTPEVDAEKIKTGEV